MIQLQVLNYILSKNDIPFLLTYDKMYYTVYSKEYDFIRKHYDSEGKLPDVATVLGSCKDFEVMEVTESKKYLENKLFEEFVLEQATETINASAKNFTKDAVKANADLIAKLQSLQPPSFTYGVDIIKNAKERYDNTIDRMSSPEMYTISTGLPELDIALGGGLRRGEELVVIYARTNNAKTWIALEMGVAAWEKGRNIGFFSPEMSANSVGYRFDTLFKHFDNHGIMGDDKTYDTDNYKRYINGLIKKDRPAFNVATPADFPNKRVTVSKLVEYVKYLKLDVLIIDGLTYLTNERGGSKKNTTENLTDISEDLMNASVELGVPIIVVLQANREGAKGKDGEVNTEAPELDTIRGSDGISHNASRCISLYKAKDIIKLYLSKNRYGEKGQHIFYQYNVNEGLFTYVPNPKDGMPAMEEADLEDDGFEDTGSPF